MVIGTTAGELIHITSPRGASSQSTTVKVCATRDRDLGEIFCRISNYFRSFARTVVHNFRCIFKAESLKLTQCIVNILFKARRQCKKSDVEKRSYVYESIWQILKNQNKLPNGEVVYPPEIESIIRAVFPAGIN